MESDINKEIKKYLESVGAFWSAVTGGGYSKPGDPDIVACFRGRYIAIEGKTPTGVQSPVQKRRQMHRRTKTTPLRWNAHATKPVKSSIPIFSAMFPAKNKEVLPCLM